ncbi:MAG: hypothetical protein ACM3XN_03790 [Chloroflexota bacterium]
MRRLIGIALSVIIAAGLLAAPAHAAGQVSISAKAGFDGFGKISSYVPVVVWLTNQGDGIAGEVVVRSRDMSGLDVEYAMPAEIAQGAKKEIRFAVPVNEMTRTIDIRFVPAGDDEGTVTAKAQLNTLPFNEIIIGVLASDPTTLSHAGAVRIDNPVRSVRVVHLDETTLPDQQLVLNNFDFLVINDFDTTRLTKAQLDAIRGWLAEGGTLAIGGGPAWQKTLAGLPDEFLPVSVTGTVQVSDLPVLSAEGGYPFQVMAPFAVNTGTLRDGADGLIAGDRIGRAAKQYGDGQTMFFGVDLALDPIAAWRGNQVLWQKLITARTPSGQDAEMQYKMSLRMQRYRGGLANALNNIPALDLPPVGILAAILVGYIALVGPINYLILKRRDKRDWGWVTIPAIALLVIAVVYIGAFKIKGREVMANEVSVVTLRPDLKLQKIESYVGVFSPTRNDYKISLSGNPLVTNVPSYYGMYYDPMQTGEESPLVMRVVYGSRTDIQFMNMSEWSLRSFTTQWYNAASGGIDAKLYGSGDRIVGTVTNSTQYVLTDCYLVTQYGLQSLGDLAPGATAAVDLGTAANPKQPNPAFYQLYNPGYNYQPQPGTTPPLPTRDEVRKRMILDGAFEGGPENGQFTGVRFIGWTEQPLSEPFVTAGRVSRSSLALVTESLTYTPWENGQYNLPIGIIGPNLLAQQGNEVGWYAGGFHLANGSEVTLDFILPEYRPMTVEALKLNAYFDGAVSTSTQAGAVIDFEIYNFTSRAYERKTLNSAADTVISHAADYVSSGGQVRLRFRATQGQWLNIQRLSIAAQGKEAR